MLRKPFILLTLTAMLAATATASTHRLATYNIRFGNSDPDTGGKDWGQRGPVCRDVVLNYDFDVVGFQEVGGSGRTYRNPLTGRTQLDDLKAWLTDYEIVAWDRNGSSRQEYVATAYKKSRYEVVDQGSFFISTTPETFSYGWDTTIEGHPRVLGWLRLRDKSSGEEFIYATTHTNDGWSLDGPYGSQLVAAKIKEIAGSLPVMVVADYNSSRTAAHAQKGLKAYHALLRDAALEVPSDKNYSLPVTNPQVTWTYNAYHAATEQSYTGSEIDFQFFLGMNILERHIVTEEFDYDGTAIPSSDHFPVFVVAELSAEQPRTLYVDAQAGAGGDGTLGAPYATIGEACAAANLGDAICVAAGTYRESVQPTCTVAISGGFTDGFTATGGTTIIDGEGLATPPIYAPGQISLTLRDLTVRGYTSTSAKTDGAILFRGADLTMERVVVEDNAASDYGGGLAVYDPDYTQYCAANNVAMRGCTFRGNSANYGAAAALGAYSLIEIDGCTFDGNTAAMSGGAVYMTFGTPESSRIWFTEAEAHVYNCSFVGNASTRSGTLYVNDEMPNVKATVVNTTFAGNTITAKGGLPAVLKTYGGTALHAKLADRPASCTLSKVGNSRLNLGHVTMVGNHATCTSPANFLASALTVDGGNVRLLNSIIAANTSNGTDAKADATVGDAERITTEARNVYTTAATVSFTADATSHVAADAAAGTAAIAGMMAGTLADGAFTPEVTRSDAEPTPFVALTSTRFDDADLATLTVLQRNLEKEFSVDIDGDGVTGTQLKTDQLGYERLAKSVPGAVEYRTSYSSIESIADGMDNQLIVGVLPDGSISIAADRELGLVRTYDLCGRTVASTATASTAATLDLAGAKSGVYIINCLGRSLKIVK